MRGTIFILIILALALSAAWIGLNRQANYEAGIYPEMTNTETIGANTAVASFYGLPYHGRLTANGEVYDMQKLTFAHKTMPFGTVVRFSYNGKSITGRCNDRGPFIAGRTFDLSYAMACSLGMVDKGVDAVQVTVLDDVK